MQDTFRALPKLTLEMGLREDFQVYPQPAENPAFPLTGQYPNQFRRLAPRFGFAWQPESKTVVRGGFGVQSTVPNVRFRRSDIGKLASGVRNLRLSCELANNINRLLGCSVICSQDPGSSAVHKVHAFACGISERASVGTGPKVICFREPSASEYSQTFVIPLTARLR